MSWFVSVDDHVIEPPHVWQSRLPAKHREGGPRIIDAEGIDVWLYAGKRKPISGLSAFSGREKGTASMDAINYADMREGAFDPDARLADMDLAGIAASMSFPSFPRFAGRSSSRRPTRSSACCASARTTTG